MHWITSRFDIALNRPLVMAIVNVTPDSFSDGGRFADADRACRHCDELVAQGADILDIGGESTRPGSVTPPADEELARVVPVLRHAVTLGVPVSVDTSEPRVMQAALEMGVDIVNDVRALRRPGAVAVVAQYRRAGVCLMHMHGEPLTMQQSPLEGDVVAAVVEFLQSRLADMVAAGVAAERVVLDPGVGFGKTVEQNLDLLRRQRELLALPRPLLIGWSRKSTLGALTGRGPQERAMASVAAALLAAQRGAAVLRVHDVPATVDALKVLAAS